MSASPHLRFSRSSPDSQGRCGAVLNVRGDTCSGHPPGLSPTAGDEFVPGWDGRAELPLAGRKRRRSPGAEHFQAAQLPARGAPALSLWHDALPEPWTAASPLLHSWKLLIAARGFNWEREHTDPIKAHEGAKGSRSGTNEGAIKPT